MILNFDHTIRNCRLMLAAIMQVRAYYPNLLTNEQWERLERHFSYILVNPRMAKDAYTPDTVLRNLAIVLKQHRGLIGYADRFIADAHDQ